MCLKPHTSEYNVIIFSCTVGYNIRLRVSRYSWLAIYLATPDVNTYKQGGLVCLLTSTECVFTFFFSGAAINTLAFSLSLQPWPFQLISGMVFDGSISANWNFLKINISVKWFEWMSFLLGQYCWISQNGHHVDSTRNSGSGEMRLIMWSWSGMIRNGRRWWVEIGTAHQIRWNILREHNWGVPSAHIKYIYYVTCVIHYLIMLWGCSHTGMYTILYLHAWELLFPQSVWEHLELHLGSTGQK